MVPAYFTEWLSMYCTMYMVPAFLVDTVQVSYYIVPAFFADKVEQVHGALLLCR